LKALRKPGSELELNHQQCVSSASDTEYQHALEVRLILYRISYCATANSVSKVIFDAQNAHRRKSSLVTAESPANLFQRRKNTECYVHALLESQRKHGISSTGGLEDIAESLAERRIASGMDKNADTPVEPKRGSIEDACPGQEDEKSWTDRMQAKHGDQVDDGQKVEVGDDSDPNAVHSRLLTKKQLSDMAWGVRELSKRLGSIKLKLKVKTVFLLTKAHDETLIGNTREVAKWLLSSERDVRYTVYVEDNLRDNKKFDSKGLLQGLGKEYVHKNEANGDNGNLAKRLRYWSNDMCRTRPHTFDFVVTLGGDGTVLYASWLFQRIVPPVLSFALGSLGFLTKFDYDEFQETLTKSFRDGVTISLRLRFEGTVMRSQKRKRTIQNGDGNQEVVDKDDSNETRDLVEELVGEEKEDERTHRPDGTYEILNDIVVDRGPNPSKSFLLLIKVKL
jgi:NAD+ kinase